VKNEADSMLPPSGRSTRHFSVRVSPFGILIGKDYLNPKVGSKAESAEAKTAIAVRLRAPHEPASRTLF
jgi:hypothetical protein